MNLLALDPGLRNPAVAVFKGGLLVHASRVKIPKATHALPLGARLVAVTNLVLAHIETYDYRPSWGGTLVTEWPRCYKRMKGDPADLFPLAGLGMMLVGRLCVTSLDVPTAPEWIGNIPKSEKGNPLDSPRGQRIWTRLGEAEKAAVVVSHDALDAVGLGLWKLGRLEIRRSFIGAIAG